MGRQVGWLARQLLQERDWGALRWSGGAATELPVCVERLVLAQDEREAKEAYWSIDNAVVVQGQLFEAAEFVVAPLLAALAGDLSEDARIRVLDLLFEIGSGVPDESEVALGNADLGSRCRKAVREGIWLVLEQLYSSSALVRKTALEIVADLETDEVRRHLILKAVVENEAVDSVVHRVASAELSKKVEASY